jgi:hypothetical protein
MKCKFCGCTDRNPCLLTEIVDPEGHAQLLGSGIELIPAGSTTNLIPCMWLLPTVCSAPPCVEKAYAEAELLADQLQFFIERSA